MKETVCILCVLLFLTGCSSLQKTAPSKTEESREQADPKVAAPADIHYPKSPSAEDHDAQIVIIGGDPIDGTLLGGYAGFSQESFSAILKTASDNISYSPLSLYYPLMMTLQANEGQTAEQLQMPSHADGRDSVEDMGNLYRRLYTDNESGQLKITNSLWIRSSYPVDRDLIKTVDKQFYAAAYDVGFSQVKTAGLMAAWTREHTNGNLSPPTRTNESIYMAILNVIYYKAWFDTEFDKKDTKKDTFHAQDGKVDTDFMHKEMESHFLTNNRDYAVTSLTLSNSFSLTPVLPKESKDIRRTMEQEGFLQGLLKDDAEGVDFDIVKFSLPKLKIHSKSQLAGVLKAMGVIFLFNIAAESNDITNEEPFFASDIQQETDIVLNEEGIETSAYMMAGATGAANMKHPKILDPNPNRSFLRVISIRMDSVELPPFIGVCSNPAL